MWVASIWRRARPGSKWDSMLLTRPLVIAMSAAWFRCWVGSITVPPDIKRSYSLGLQLEVLGHNTRHSKLGCRGQGRFQVGQPPSAIVVDSSRAVLGHFSNISGRDVLARSPGLSTLELGPSVRGDRPMVAQFASAAGRKHQCLRRSDA